jgi:hypothetical protein
MTTHHSEPPTYRRETYFLARPYQNSTSSIALQVQRVLPTQPDDVSSTFSSVGDRGDARPGFEPILDIKRNRPPIKKLLRKVRSFSGSNHRGTNAGSIVIPPPNARYSVSDFDKLRQACENYLNGNSGNNSTIPSNNCPLVEWASSASQQHLKTFSVYERDSPKLPLAQFSKNGITFSQRTTPLVARHSRLDRQDSIKLDHDHSILPYHSSNGVNNNNNNNNNNTNPLIGQVSWNLVEDRAQEYKVIDSSTNTVIGRWKLIDRHTKLSNLSLSSSAIIRESYASSAGGSSRRVATAVPSQPFYSGQAPHLALSRDKRELVLDRTAVWCFVVKGTVVATLKGYELSLISHPASIAGSDETETMTHKIVRDRLYLDEYALTLRQRLVAAALREGDGSLLANVSIASLSRPLQSLPEQQHSTSGPGIQKKIFRRHSMPPIMTDQVLSLPPHQTTVPPKPPLPIFEESSALDQYVTNFNRLKLSDGIMISALSLMLNLDDKLAVFTLRKKLLEEAAAQEQQQQRQQRSPRRKSDEVTNDHNENENENNAPLSGFASRLKRSWKMPNFAKIRVF